MRRKMNYNLIESKVNSNMYDVLETTTDQVIRSFPADKFLEAKNFMRHLNLGGGFDAWTPSFFLKKVDTLFKK